jgi:AcrR family transcriptional regulator
METSLGSIMNVRIRKSAAERKAEIIGAAIRLAGDVGPDRLTTEKLAMEVGISQAGIFRHFPTKNDIWEAVAKRIGELLQASAAQGNNDPDRPVDQLQNLVLNHLAFIQATPAIPAILFSRELHAENENLRIYFAGLIARRQHRFSQIIATEIEAGRFDDTLDPDDAAYLILALIQGLAMRWSLSARGFDLVTEGRRLLQLLVSGFQGSTQTLDHGGAEQ